MPGTRAPKNISDYDHYETAWCPVCGSSVMTEYLRYKRSTGAVVGCDICYVDPVESVHSKV